MLNDPVNLFFSHFIFGGFALIVTALATNTILNLISNIRNRKQQAELAEALTSILKSPRHHDDNENLN